MSERREHLNAYRAWAAGIAETMSDLGLSRSSWRSWLHHPLANTLHFFWTHLPHHPQWKREETTVGAVDHGSREDADYGWDFDRCARCGIHANETRWENP